MSSNGPPKARLRLWRVGQTMWYVHILKSLEYKKSYVGCTDNIARRLNEHNSGKSSYTRRFKPWEIIKTEKFKSYREARIREKFYKSGVGRQELKSLFDTLS